MSLRDDAHLSAQERAALANLEAVAVAEDPHLAAKLGGRRPILRVRRPRLPHLRLHTWWGPVLVGAGLTLMVFSLGAPFGLLLGLTGAVMVGAGVWLMARWLQTRLAGNSAEGSGEST